MTTADARRPFRFVDHREKYLLFTTTCSEKRETARRIAREFAFLSPRPPALRVFQAGAGEGTLLNMVLRELHHRWPAVPFVVVIKEVSPEFIRMAVRNLADRFREHPQLVLVFTNMLYTESPALMPRGQEAQSRLRWRELALTGTSAHGFEAQINAEMTLVDEDWQYRQSRKTGSWFYVEPAVLVINRADQSFALDAAIPRQGISGLAYDLIIASQPYRSRLPAEIKVRTLLAPLATSLAPGGRMITIQSRGGDPGMEIIADLWPDADPFPTPRAQLLAVLRQQLAEQDPDLVFDDLPGEDAEFTFDLLLSPNEAESNIGTSTLLAAWNAAAYVAQIEDQLLTEAMCESRFLDSTRRVFGTHERLWFNDECFVVSRRDRA